MNTTSEKHTATTCSQPGCEFPAGHEQEHPHGRRLRCDNECEAPPTVRVQLHENRIKDVCESCATEGGDPELLEATGVLSDARRGDTVLGLALEDRPPKHWTPLEAVVIVKCLDEDGDMTMFHTATPALNSYEAIGMLRWTSLTLEHALTGDNDDDA